MTGRFRIVQRLGTFEEASALAPAGVPLLTPTRDARRPGVRTRLSAPRDARARTLNLDQGS
jgi:hypothetical protein